MNNRSKPAPPKVTYESWTILWGLIFETYRNAFYQEKLSDSLLNRLIRFDYIVTFLSVITGAGAGVAGWTMWEEEGFRLFWAFGTAAAPLMVALHIGFQIPTKMRDSGKERESITLLRFEAEKSWNDLRLTFQDSSVAYDKLKVAHDKTFDKLKNVYARLNPTPFLSKKQMRYIDDSVNRLLQVGPYA